MRFDQLEDTRIRVPEDYSQSNQVCRKTARRLRRVRPVVSKRMIAEKELLVIEMPVINGKPTPVVVEYELLEDAPIL